jgi:hypothetical protein
MAYLDRDTTDTDVADPADYDDSDRDELLTKLGIDPATPLGEMAAALRAAGHNVPKYEGQRLELEGHLDQAKGKAKTALKGAKKSVRSKTR